MMPPSKEEARKAAYRWCALAIEEANPGNIGRIDVLQEVERIREALEKAGVMPGTAAEPKVVNTPPEAKRNGHG